MTDNVKDIWVPVQLLHMISEQEAEDRLVFVVISTATQELRLLDQNMDALGFEDFEHEVRDILVQEARARVGLIAKHLNDHPGARAKVTFELYSIDEATALQEPVDSQVPKRVDTPAEPLQQDMNTQV